MNRLATDGGFVFAEYRGSTQVLVGVIRPQRPKIFATRWSDRNRPAKLKTLEVSKARIVSVGSLPLLPPKPARATISRWHKAGKLIERLVTTPSAFRERATASRRSISSGLNTAIEALEEADAFDPTSDADARVRVMEAIVRRQGQPAFRRKLLKLYGGRCAISGCDLEQALEAAHIKPYRGLDTNHVRNGLLLRSDLHVLFDLRLITISPRDLTVNVRRDLRKSVYGEFHGRRLFLPTRRSQWPSRRALKLHSQER